MNINTPNSPKSPSSQSRPGYEYLVVFMLGKVIQDMTVEFCDRFVDKASRTHDQMVQAARSNPQNIAEGFMAESLKSYIFLAGVAHGSNEELAKDFQDFLRQRNLPIWEKDHPKVREFREFRVCWISSTSLNTPQLPETPQEAANMLLTFCQMESFLLAKLVESLKKKHTEEGGFTENLYRKRVEFRRTHPDTQKPRKSRTGFLGCWGILGIFLGIWVILGVWTTNSAQAATAIYRSVGPSNTTKLATGTTNALTISGTTATFASVLADNIGVGDVIQYDSDNNGSIDVLAFIHGRTSSTVYTVAKADGSTPTATAASDNDWSIFRAYTSLYNAERGVENTAINATYRNFDDWTAGGDATTDDVGKDLVASNQQWNIAAYGDAADTSYYIILDGWTTGSQEYLKFFTPTSSSQVGVSQRHQGVRNTGFRVVVDADGNSRSFLDIREDYVMIDGLALDITGQYANSGFYVENTLNIGNKITLSNNFIYGMGRSIRIDNLSVNAYIHNNIIYNNGVAGYAGLRFSGNVGNIYNNTIIANKLWYAFQYAAGTVYSKNNLAKMNVGGSGFISNGATIIQENSSSSDASADDFGGSGNKINQSVIFADPLNKDFHLSPLDTAARNAGTDLSAEISATDIDGNTRPSQGTWDIGADEAAKFVAYSVGQTTSNLMTGTPTMTISNGAATFSTAQTGNIGVGDRVTYNTSSIAYISSKVSTSVWTLVTATGEIPADVGSAQTVNSITREYTSLSAAEAGATDANHLNTADLVAGNFQLNFPLYYDSGPDTAAVTISGFITTLSNHIKVYAPNSTTSEVNQSQRHSGKWDDGRYSLQTTASASALDVRNSNVRIEGLQIYKTNSSYAGIGTGGNDGLVGELWIYNNIIRGGGNQRIISLSSFTSGSKVKLWNNIIYSTVGGELEGIRISAGIQSYIYNNTMFNTGACIKREGLGTMMVKNNISQFCAVDYSGTFAVDSDYNISSDGTAPGANSKNNTTVKFLDAKNGDFRLDPSDTAANDAGANLSADANFAFSLDNVGHTRGTDGAWDIGANEAATEIFYSIGQNTNDHKVGSPAMSIASGVATFSVAQTANNTGVGDKITYNTSSVAYISGKISQTQWKVITAKGAVPANVTNATVNSISHTFSAINQAIGNGANYINRTEYLNTKDLVSGNYIVNLPVYFDSGSDTLGIVVAPALVTSPQNKIRVYAPNNINTEVNVNQRHNGKWDDNKYHFRSGGGFNIPISYLEIDGLQLDVSGNGVYSYAGSDGVVISNSIIRSSYAAGYCVRADGVNSPSSSRNYVFNNIIYGCARGIARGSDGGGKIVYVYNNSVFDATTSAIADRSGSKILAINNIAQSSADGFEGTFLVGSNYNISHLASDAPGANSKNSTTVSFVDAANKNFHLASTDTAARNAGVSLQHDPYLWFEYDIDGQVRDGSWDIGADEFVSVTAQAPQSVSPLATVGLDSGLVGYWSFDGQDIDWNNPTSEIRDKSGNALHGDAVNLTRANAVDGKLGQGMRFDGSSSRLAISNFQFPISNQFSISKWINIQTLATGKPIISQWGGGQNNILIKTDDTNSDEIKICIASSITDDCTVYGATSDADLKVNAWNQLQVVYDGTQGVNAEKLKVYIDGTQKNLSFVGTVPSAIQVSSTSALEIGGNLNLSAYSSALFDEVRIYRRVLSVEEIGMLFRSGQVKLQSVPRTIQDGLIAQWTMDGGDVDWSQPTAEIRDSSGNANHGDALNLSQSSVVDGKLGQGMTFNGSDSYIDAGDIAAIDNASALTITAWMKRSAVNSIVALGKFEGTSSFTTLTMWTDGKIHFDVSNNSSSFGTANSNNTEWQHVVMVFDGTQSDNNSRLKGYLNGVSQTLTFFGTIPATTYNGVNFRIGRAHTYYSQGQIDDVRIYNRALSAEEVSQIFNYGKATIRR